MLFLNNVEVYVLIAVAVAAAVGLVAIIVLSVWIIGNSKQRRMASNAEANAEAVTPAEAMGITEEKSPMPADPDVTPKLVDVAFADKKMQETDASQSNGAQAYAADPRYYSQAAYGGYGGWAYPYAPTVYSYSANGLRVMFCYGTGMPNTVLSFDTNGNAYNAYGRR